MNGVFLLKSSSCCLYHISNINFSFWNGDIIFDFLNQVSIISLHNFRKLWNAFQIPLVYTNQFPQIFLSLTHFRCENKFGNLRVSSYKVCKIFTDRNLRNGKLTDNSIFFRMKLFYPFRVSHQKSKNFCRRMYKVRGLVICFMIQKNVS